MPFTATATYTDRGINGAFSVSRNSVQRQDFNFSGIKGWLAVWLGRTGTTALTDGVEVRLYRTFNNTSSPVGVPVASLTGQTAAAVETTCAASGNNSNTTILTVADTTGFAAGDLVFIEDSGAGNSEFCHVSEVISATQLRFDLGTRFAHNNVAHEVRNQADRWLIEIDGGPATIFSHRLVIDYGAATTGEAVAVQLASSSLDSYKDL